MLIIISGSPHLVARQCSAGQDLNRGFNMRLNAGIGDIYLTRSLGAPLGTLGLLDNNNDNKNNNNNNNISQKGGSE